MNMRAAEAIVSSAPNPMKIFPISEVLSQVLSLLLAALPAITGAPAEVTGGSAEATASGTAAAGGLASCSARSTSLS